jgi:hypothetical protein
MMTVLSPHFLGSFLWCISPAFLSFASAKMNSGSDVVLSSGRIPWVRFAIFVVHQTCFISKRAKRRLKPALQTKVRATRATWILSLSGEWERQLDRYVADCRRFMPRSDNGTTKYTPLPLVTARKHSRMLSAAYRAVTAGSGV